jgi:PAS domain S-box-containing protein
MKEETKTKNELIKELKVLRTQVTKLKKSEARHRQEKQELITREEKFASIFHSSPGAYAIIGFKDGRIVDLNDSFVQLTGYSREELLGHTTVELKLHVEPEKLIRLRQRLNNNEVIRNVEFAYRTKNGEIRSGLYSAEVILLSGKQYILSEIYDINERKKVEVELKKSSTEISDLYNNAPCGYHSLGDDGTFLIMNDTELRWLGYDRSEVIGRKKFTDLITDASQKIFQRTFPVLQKQGSMSNLELEMVRKDGTILPVLLNATTVMDETGKFVMTRSTVIDNTGLKQIRETLIESEEKFNKAFHSSPIAMSITTIADSRLIEINESFLKISGYQRQEVIGKTVKELNLYHGYDQREYIIKCIAERGYVHDLEILTNKKNGDVRHGVFDIQTIELNGEKCLLSVINDVTERKKAEEAIRENEERFRRIFEDGPIGMILADSEGYFIKANALFCNMLGYTEKELYKFTSRNITHTDDLEKDIDNVRKILTGENKVYKTIKRYTRKDGEIIWGALTLSSVRNSTGEFQYYLGMIDDITGRRQIEEALQKKTAQLEQFFDCNVDLLCIADVDGYFRRLNREWENVLGYKLAELEGRRFLDFVHPDDLPSTLNAISQLNQQNKILNFTNRYRCQDGSYRWIEWRSFPEGKNIYAAARDITERIKTEEALKTSEERFRSFFENAIEGIFQSTPEGRFIHVNNSMARMCGFESPAEMIASITDIANQYFVISEERKIINKKMEEQGKIEDTEYQVYRKDGTKIWMLVNARVVKNNAGKVIYYEGTTQDITFRKEAEEERRRLEELLRRSEKMEAMGKLAGGVAHDLNNVLGVLVGYSELMLMEIPEGHHLRRHVSNIMQSGERAAAIIQDLLTLARRGVQISDVVNLNSIISCYLNTPEFELLKSHYPQITFKTDLAEDLLNIKGSSVHLNKTVMNLVANAAEAIAGDGEVMIQTTNSYFDQTISGYENMKEGDYVLLKITDSGKGISPTDIGKIFEPFYTTKVMGRSGTGLGLAVVWGTVKDHKGYIDVQSKEGMGSSFSLYFPVTRDKKSVDREHISPAAYQGRGESVLIVDDVKEQRELAVNILSTLGYKVNVVASGEEAVEYVKRNKTDLIVLDMIMDPGIDGLQTYQRICDINPKQKAIIVSGFSETDRVKKAHELGAGAYVRKPYIMEKIGLAVRQELDK